MTVKRKKSGVQPGMKSGKRFFSCRGEREMLSTRCDSLPVSESRKGKLSLSAGGWWCMMRDGEQRRWPMMVIPRAKQPHSQVDCLGARTRAMKAGVHG
jgi:hypothetical protein